MTGRAPSELEPKRLLEDEASPRALRDALHALRERAPSEASAARIHERIQTPPAAGHGGAIAAASLAVIGLVGVLAWSAWPSLTAPAPRPIEDARPQAQSGPPPADSDGEASSAPDRRVQRATVEAPAPLAPVAQHEPEVRAAASAPKEAPAATVVAEPPRTERRPKLAPRPAVAAATPAQPAVTAERPEPAVVPNPAPKPAAADEAEHVFADPQDEAGLLYRAKRLSSSEPNAALRLLVLHEASFPTGAFAEERDMLEIQIHERLGHRATVKRLAAIFKQRYPGSVYRVSP